jgi:hypothetical protein
MLNNSSLWLLLIIPPSKKEVFCYYKTPKMYHSRITSPNIDVAANAVITRLPSLQLLWPKPPV